MLQKPNYFRDDFLYVNQLANLKVAVYLLHYWEASTATKYIQFDCQSYNKMKNHIDLSSQADMTQCDIYLIQFPKYK